MQFHSVVFQWKIKNVNQDQVININSNNPIFYPFSIKITKCSGNCNNINNPYAKICVPDVIKDLNVKLFNLMSETMKLDL